MPTSKDVARLAGVSQSTVSYVMSGKRAVSEETRKRVQGAMAQLAYHPNAGARALRGARSDVIALVIHLGSDAEGLALSSACLTLGKPAPQEWPVARSEEVPHVVPLGALPLAGQAALAPVQNSAASQVPFTPLARVTLPVPTGV